MLQKQIFSLFLNKNIYKKISLILLDSFRLK